MDQREIDEKLERLCVRRPPGSCGLAAQTDLADLAAIVRDQQARIAELERQCAAAAQVVLRHTPLK